LQNSFGSRAEPDRFAGFFFAHVALHFAKDVLISFPSWTF
jgi:hypothetical protein